MKALKKFNEMNSESEKFSGSREEVTKHILSRFPDDESKVKVKHLIQYLEQFDPESPVELDKGGWEHEDPLEAIKISGLFQEFKNTLFINN